MDEKFFPTVAETKKAAATIDAICEAAPVMKESLVEAFKEAECMEDFEARTVTYLWYEVRNLLAGAKSAGIEEDLVETILDEGYHSPGTRSPNTFKQAKTVLRTIIRNSHELII